MAAMNNKETAPERSNLNCTATNKAAIDKHTHNADKVHKVIARLIQRVRLARFNISDWLLLRMRSAVISLKRRLRSTARPKRLVSTPSIEPIPVSKKTGATAC